MTKHTESPGLDVNSSQATRGPAIEHEVNSKIKLITVHGTGAGDVTETGDRWWQLESNFLNELSTRLHLDPSRIEISPFQWELGPNSETRRRAAGKALYKKLKSYEESGNDYYLIGHSHGGSVIYNTLLHSAAIGGPLNRLKSWCTVGTPFLDYRQNRFLFQRLEGISLTLYSTWIVALLLGLWALWNSGNDSVLQSMSYALIFYGVICFVGLYLYERFKKRSWYTRAQKKETARLYSHQWLGLWHREDEAISALYNIKNVNAPIIPITFMKPLVAFIMFGLVIGFGVYLALDLPTLKIIADYLMIDLVPISEEGEILVSKGESIAALTWMIVGVMGYLLLVGWILSKLLNFIVKQLGRPFARILNWVVWSSIKQRAWGDDLSKEDVKEISSHPPEFMNKFESLPEVIATPLREHSERHAIITLHKVREILGMIPNSHTAPDLRSELSESLKWQELIHTSYFDVPQFIDLLAFGLHRVGLAELKEGFTQTDQLAGWFDRARGQSKVAALVDQNI